jgi:ankyrin repeat protein/preprotein translocase subunit SecA
MYSLSQRFIALLLLLSMLLQSCYNPIAMNVKRQRSAPRVYTKKSDKSSPQSDPTDPNLLEIVQSQAEQADWLQENSEEDQDLEIDLSNQSNTDEHQIDLTELTESLSKEAQYQNQAETFYQKDSFFKSDIVQQLNPNTSNTPSPPIKIDNQTNKKIRDPLAGAFVGNLNKTTLTCPANEPHTVSEKNTSIPFSVPASDPSLNAPNTSPLTSSSASSTPAQSPITKLSQEPPKEFITAKGQIIVPYKTPEGPWKAQVTRFPGASPITLPIIAQGKCEIDQALHQLALLPKEVQKYRIHLIDNPKSTPEQTVYIGSLGLLGGGLFDFFIDAGIAIGNGLKKGVRFLYGVVTIPFNAIAYCGFTEEVKPLPWRVTTLYKYDEDDLPDSQVNNSRWVNGEYVSFYEENGYWYARTSKGHISVKSRQSVSMSLEDLVNSHFSFFQGREKSGKNFLKFNFLDYDAGEFYELELITSPDQVQKDRQARRSNRRQAKINLQKQTNRKDENRRITNEGCADFEERVEQNDNLEHENTSQTQEAAQQVVSLLNNQSQSGQDHEIMQDGYLSDDEELIKNELEATEGSGIDLGPINSSSFLEDCDEQKEDLGAESPIPNELLSKELIEKQYKAQECEREEHPLGKDLHYLIEDAEIQLRYWSTIPPESYHIPAVQDHLHTLHETLLKLPEALDNWQISIQSWQKALNDWSISMLKPSFRPYDHNLTEYNNSLIHQQNAQKQIESTRLKISDLLYKAQTILDTPAYAKALTTADLRQEAIDLSSKALSNVQEIAIDIEHSTQKANQATQAAQNKYNKYKTNLQKATKRLIRKKVVAMAYELNHEPLLSYLSGRGKDHLSAQDHQGKTALHHALMRNQPEVAQWLIDHGALNIKDNQGSTPLHLGSKHGHADIIKYMLEKGAEIEEKDKQGRTPLMEASRYGHLDTVKHLVEQGVNIEAKDKQGRTPLMQAAELGEIYLVKYLIEKGAKLEIQDNENKTALTLAKEAGHTEIVKYLLEKGANIEKKKSAIYKSFLFSLKKKSNRTPLTEASRYRHIDPEYLLKKMANIEAKCNEGRTALMLASEKGRLEVVKLLLVEKGLDMEEKDKYGQTALLMASEEGHLEVVKHLLEQRANIEAKDNEGRTALMLASEKGRLELVKLLLEKWLDIEDKDKYGQTALLLASEKGRLEVVKYLLEEGANTEAKDNEGRTALMLASERGRLEIVKLLLEKGVDIEEKDEFGKTALLLASKNAHLEVVKHLLEQRANIEAKDNEGKTALMLASKKGPLELVKYLRKEEAKYIAAQKNTPNLCAPYQEEKLPIPGNLQIALKFALEQQNKAQENYEKSEETLQQNQEKEEQAKIQAKEAIEQLKKSKQHTKNLTTQVYVEPILISISTYLQPITDAVELHLSQLLEQPSCDTLQKQTRHLLEQLYTWRQQEQTKHNQSEILFLYDEDLSEHEQIYIMGEVLSQHQHNINHIQSLIDKLKAHKPSSIELSGPTQLVSHNPKNKSKTPLMSAAQNGYLEVVKYLLEQGSDIEEKDEDGMTALVYASKAGRLDTVKYLVEQGANIEDKDNVCRALLISAAQNGHLELLKYLAEQGANIEEKDEYSMTALMRGALYSELDIVKYLVEKGANIEEKNNFDQTALMFAAENKKLDIVKYLVEKGADIEDQDKGGGTVLLYAARAAELEIVKYLLEKGASIEESDGYGDTALISAAKYGHLEILKLLVEKGADIEERDKHGKTALACAAENKKLDIVKYLLEKGANIEEKGNYSQTVLMHAVKAGCLELVKYLVETGANIEHKDFYSKTALLYAAEAGCLDVVKYLVETGANIEAKASGGQTILMHAAKSGCLDVVKYLVEKGANIEEKDTDGQTILIYAAESGKLDLIEHLIEKGAKLEIKHKDKYGKTILMYAAKNGHLALVKYLIDKGASLEEMYDLGQTVLMYAVESGELDLIKYLIEKGANLNIEEKDNPIIREALMKAAEDGQLELIKYLIEKGANIEEKDNPIIREALMKAAEDGQLELIKYLIEKGANIEEKNIIGQTVLIKAAQAGQLDIVKYLLEKGANIEVKDEYGKTALMEAARYERLDVVKYLVEQGANIEEKDEDGKTAFRHAAQAYNLDVVKYLAQKGANIEWKNKDGKTAIELAIEHGHQEALDVFKAVKKVSLALQLSSSDQENEQKSEASSSQSIQQLDQINIDQEHATDTIPQKVNKIDPYLQPITDAVEAHLDFIDQEPISHTLQQQSGQLLGQLSNLLKQEETKYRQAELLLQDSELNDFRKKELSTQILNQQQHNINHLRALTFKLTRHSSIKRMTSHFGKTNKVKPYQAQQPSLYDNLLSSKDSKGWADLVLTTAKNQGSKIGESIKKRFYELASLLENQYSNKDLSAVLQEIYHKQLNDYLSLDKVIEVMEMLPVEASQAISLLRLSPDQWYTALKSSWLQTQLHTHCDYLSPEQSQHLLQQLVSLDWRTDSILTLLNNLPKDHAPEALDSLLTYAGQHPFTSDQILYALEKAKKAFTEVEFTNRGIYDNYICQAHHNLASLLLESKLSKLLPTQGQASSANSQIQELLEQRPYYKPINNFIEQLWLLEKKNKEQLLSAENLNPLMSLLREYRLDASMYSNILQSLLSTAPKKWTDYLHAKLLEHSFGESSYERSVDEIIEYIAAHSPGVAYVQDKASFKLAYENIIEAFNNTSKLLADELPIKEWDRAKVSQWAQMFKDRVKDPEQGPKPLQSEVIAVVMQAAKLIHGFVPRKTQLLCLLVLLHPEQGKGRLAQVNTGEGKSLTVAMLAAIQSLNQRKSDIVTSSTELSVPEVKKQKPFFELLCLTVSENSSQGVQDANKKKKESYSQHNVYGTASDFQGDILRTEFFGKEIRMHRPFEGVIVDEVDNMLFDSRSHSIRLSGQMPATDHLELLHGMVWQQVKLIASHLISDQGNVYFINEEFYKNKSGEITILSGDSAGKQANLEDYDLVEGGVEEFITKAVKDYLERLLRDLSEYPEQKKDYEDSVILEKELLKLLTEIANEKDPKVYKEKVDKSNELQEKYKKLPWLSDQQKNPPHVKIPKHLIPFAKQQMPKWIQSAINAALSYKKGYHYNVARGKIVPVDYQNTGVWQHNMVWSNGLAQFLQIKEGLKVLPENISTNFISSVGYFKRYQDNLYGLTGTLGNKTTHNFFEKVYETDLVIVPPYKKRTIEGNEKSSYNCKELSPILVKDKDINKWYEAIEESALNHTRQNRSVLIICKYIKQVHALEERLKRKYDKQKIFTYTGKKKFLKDQVYPGEIIIATNIAGRGTDLTPSEIVELNGGLHVCITFLPESYRVELQNAGRTARKGCKGTAQLILHQPEGVSIEELKAARDEKEAQGLQEAINEVELMAFKDKLFEEFCKLENELLPTLDAFKRIEQSRALEEIWENYSSETFKEEKLIELYESTIDQLIEEKINNSSKLDILDAYEKAEEKKAIKANIKAKKPFSKFKEDYLLRKRREFIKEVEDGADKGALHIEVKEAFEKGESYVPKNGELAIKYGWSIYERKALEERFGLWFHANMSKKEDVKDFAAIEKSFESFLKEIKKDGEEDNLIKNPYYLIQKGNDQLHSKHSFYSARKSYDRAIDLDPDFSLNARYGKVMALLTPEKNKDDHAQAIKELEEAKFLLDQQKQRLSTFQMVVSQVQVPQQYTLQHLQHHLDILFSQDKHIDMAIGVLKKAQEKGNHVEITEKIQIENLFTENASKDHREQALQEARENGLLYLFTIKEKKPTPWLSICTVAFIGLVQVAVGIIGSVCTAGIATTLFLKQGISDLVTSITSAISGNFSWKEWGMNKLISVAVSLISVGMTESFAKIKDSFKGLKKAIQTGYKAIKDSGVARSLVTNQIKTVGLEIGQRVATQCTTILLDYTTQSLLTEALEKEIKERVSKKIINSLLENSLIKKAIEQDIKSGKNYWSNIFIKEGFAILEEKDSELQRLITAIVETVIETKMFDIAKELSSQGHSKAAIVFKLLGKGASFINKFDNNINEFTNKFLNKLNGRIDTNYKESIEEKESKTDQSKSQEVNQEADQKEEIEAPAEEEFVHVIEGQEDFDPDEINVLDRNNGKAYSTEAKIVNFSSNIDLNRGPDEAVKSLGEVFVDPISSRLLGNINQTFISPLNQKLADKFMCTMLADVSNNLARQKQKIIIEAAEKELKRQEELAQQAKQAANNEVTDQDGENKPKADREGDGKSEDQAKAEDANQSQPLDEKTNNQDTDQLEDNTLDFNQLPSWQEQLMMHLVNKPDENTQTEIDQSYFLETPEIDEIWKLSGEGLLEKYAALQEQISKSPDFKEQSEKVLYLKQQLELNPNDSELKNQLEEAQRVFQKNDLYLQGVLLGMKAINKVDENNNAISGLYATSDDGFIDQEDKQEIKNLEEQNKLLREYCVDLLRKKLARDVSPSLKEKGLAFTKGAGENLKNTWDFVTKDAPIFIMEFASNLKKTFLNGKDETGFSDTVNEVGSMLEMLFYQTKYDWENPEDYRLRVEAAKEVTEKVRCFQEFHNVRELHLGQAEKLGYLSMELLQFIYGDKVIKVLGKGMLNLGEKGAKLAKGAFSAGVKTIENTFNPLLNVLNPQLVMAGAHGGTMVTNVNSFNFLKFSTFEEVALALKESELVKLLTSTKSLIDNSIRVKKGKKGTIIKNIKGTEAEGIAVFENLIKGAGRTKGGKAYVLKDGTVVFSHYSTLTEDFTININNKLGKRYKIRFKPN